MLAELMTDFKSVLKTYFYVILLEFGWCVSAVLFIIYFDCFNVSVIFILNCFLSCISLFLLLLLAVTEMHFPCLPFQVSSWSADLQRRWWELERRLLLRRATRGLSSQNYQQKEEDISTWHFIYLDNSYSSERPSPKKYIWLRVLKKKGEDRVHIVSKRTSHCVSLWGLALEGSGM